MNKQILTLELRKIANQLNNLAFNIVEYEQANLGDKFKEQVIINIASCMGQLKNVNRELNNIWQKEWQEKLAITKKIMIAKKQKEWEESKKNGGKINNVFRTI